ncbi:MAG: DUF1493 family protein [Nitrospinae bacterium]|nr:DUF1493 family protein [Nitrospinota bacterium]
MQLEEDVISFLSEWLSCSDRSLNLDTRIGEDLGVDGDDAVEVLEEYSKRFSVDISSFPFNDYFGPEVGFNPLYFLISIFSSNRSKFKSLYICDLVEGAEKKALVG